MKYAVAIAGREFVVDIEGSDQVTLDGEPREVELHSIDGEALFSLLIDNKSYEIFVERHQGQYHVLIEGRRHVVGVEDERTKRLMELAGPEAVVKGEIRIEAPMPGMVVEVLASPGDGIQAGQALVVLEAMKMENEIRAPRGGKIRTVLVSAGQTVDQGQALVVVE